MVKAIFLIIALGCLCLDQAQTEYTKWENGIDKGTWDVGMTVGDAKNMIARWDALGDRLRNEENLLAGTYFKGGYSAGYFLRWSNKEFILIPYFDQNLITDFSYGKVTFVNASRIIFTPERDLKGGRSLGKTPNEWTAIWNYFVPVDQLKDFGEFHAGLGVFNEFNGACCEFVPNFLCQKIEGGKPYYPVPPRYAQFVKRSIEGRIVAVGRKRSVKNWGYQGELYGQWMERAVLIPVTVDLRGDPRVKRNMLFRLLGEGELHQYLQIVRVGRRISVGYVVRDISFGGKETYRNSPEEPEKPLPPVKVGMKLTTRPWLSQPGK